MKSDKNNESENKASIPADQRSDWETEGFNDKARKSKLLFQPSIGTIIDREGSETEVAAEISVPKEGHCGWAVVAASFSCIFILDGIFFTFGSIYKDISYDLGVEESFVALINSVAIALYFIMGPVVSAMINRFGFRCCAMTGSIIVSFSYFGSYFAENYVVLLILYGIIPGFGGCFIYMSSQLVVGFYFERLRAIAMALAGLGQSFGIMIMSTVNAHLCQIAGWRITTLFHSGLFGLIYFIGMVYRPLVSLIVTQTSDDSSNVTYLPNLSTMSVMSVSRKRLDSVLTVNAPSAAERVFQAVSNVNFPTVASMLEEEDEEEEEGEREKEEEDEEGEREKEDEEEGEREKEDEEEEDADEEKADIPKPGPSSEIMSAKSYRRRSSAKRVSIRESQIVIKANTEPPKNLKWWQKCCHWEKHAEESRPMYRDDAFYNGTLHNLPAYQKSLMSTRRKKTGLEYRMAVSRTVTTVDLQERKGVFTTSVRRILATMLNVALLRRRSFQLVCLTGFLTHVGLLIPYVFLPDRNKMAGVDQKHCNLFVSVIGFSNAIGRLIAGIIACKYSPVKIYGKACLMAGTAAIISNFSFNVHYQYFCCVLFGIAVAHMSTLRSLVIVDLYGLPNLTNATGMLLMFQGFGSLLSTPLSSVLRIQFGYLVSFCVAGAFLASGCFVIFSAKQIALNEDAKAQVNSTRSKLFRTRSRPGPDQSA